ncbi:MAG: hypothetical protein WCD89_14820 [Anaerocolumna sp.]
MEDDLLAFQREEMLDEKVLRCRDGKIFETRYLRKDFPVCKKKQTGFADDYIKSKVLRNTLGGYFPALDGILTRMALLPKNLVKRHY